MQQYTKEKVDVLWCTCTHGRSHRQLKPLPKPLPFHKGLFGLADAHRYQNLGVFENGKLGVDRAPDVLGSKWVTGKMKKSSWNEKTNSSDIVRRAFLLRQFQMIQHPDCRQFAVPRTNMATHQRKTRLLNPLGFRVVTIHLSLIFHHLALLLLNFCFILLSSIHHPSLPTGDVPHFTTHQKNTQLWKQMASHSPKVAIGFRGHDKPRLMGVAGHRSFPHGILAQALFNNLGCSECSVHSPRPSTNCFASLKRFHKRVASPRPFHAAGLRGGWPGWVVF